MRRVIQIRYHHGCPAEGPQLCASAKQRVFDFAMEHGTRATMKSSHHKKFATNTIASYRMGRRHWQVLAGRSKIMVGLVPPTLGGYWSREGV
jgi:hypothetical protein